MAANKACPGVVVTPTPDGPEVSACLCRECTAPESKED